MKPVPPKSRTRIDKWFKKLKDKYPEAVIRERPEGFEGEDLSCGVYVPESLCQRVGNAVNKFTSDIIFEENVWVTVSVLPLACQLPEEAWVVSG